jgi:DNA-nicking Smr family endonuclease
MKAPAKRPKRGRALDASEEWLWREVTRDVKSYRPLPAVSHLPPQKPVVLQPTSVQPAKTHGAQPHTRAQAGLGTGLDGTTARRLAQGRLAPEAVIDLHGMTQDHAHAALERFLAISSAHGRRCVLIITGKGGPNAARDEGDAPWARRRPGVLRSLVPLWLEHSSQRGRIAAVKKAHRTHGGDGALYVYLRSKGVQPL